MYIYVKYLRSIILPYFSQSFTTGIIPTSSRYTRFSVNCSKEFQSMCSCSSFIFCSLNCLQWPKSKFKVFDSLNLLTKYFDSEILKICKQQLTFLNNVVRFLKLRHLIEDRFHQTIKYPRSYLVFTKQKNPFRILPQSFFLLSSVCFSVCGSQNSSFQS